MSNLLVENIDYYLNDEGMLVMTEKYHKDRGYCCGNGCMHCPFDFESVPEPRKSFLKKNLQKLGKPKESIS